MSRIQVFPGLSAAGWQRHPLHGEGAAWAEKNCYADLWVGLLHHLQMQPMAMLGFGVAADFEGDQWTFFKPSAGELWDLYGIDVQEMTVWRPLIEHAAEHLAAGRLVSAEADAWFMPDTAATDYRRQHTKTTVLMADLDIENQRLGYFHNSGYYELEGEDFRGIFGLDAPEDAARLPLFAELVKIDRRVQRSEVELAGLALQMLRRHLARRPRDNPFARFAQRIETDWSAMLQRGLPHYHAWAFANIRQAGAAFELAARHVEWLDAQLQLGLAEAAPAFDAISQGCKTLILKGARAANGRRPLDATGLCGELAQQWEKGMGVVVGRVG